MSQTLAQSGRWGLGAPAVQEGNSDPSSPRSIWGFKSRIADLWKMKSQTFRENSSRLHSFLVHFWGWAHATSPSLFWKQRPTVCLFAHSKALIWCVARIHHCLLPDGSHYSQNLTDGSPQGVLETFETAIRTQSSWFLGANVSGKIITTPSKH